MATKRGTKKPKAPGSTAYLIKVAVDLYGNFTYTADGIPDASIIRPLIGDTISWAVTWNGIPVPFQVEFPGFGPFAGGVLVTRSTFLPTTPLTVFVDSHDPNLNFAFKYTVSTINGWSDDPIVVPVPSDGLNPLDNLKIQMITLSVQNGNLTLTPEEASFDPGEVSCWQWAAGQTKDDFTITFIDPPTGWPTSASSGGAKMITLNLQAAGDDVAYTLQTLHLGLSNDDGTVTIS